nr:DUF4775 domain-containing protein [Lachnospiraceae bacterium]
MRKLLCLLLSVQMVLLSGCNIYYGYSAPSRDIRDAEESANEEALEMEDESSKENEPAKEDEPAKEPTPILDEEEEEPAGPVIEVTENVTELADGLSVTEFRGDYGFEKFIARGGVASDEDLIRFLADTLMPGIGSFLLK